jgi:hypothetical protein
MPSTLLLPGALMPRAAVRALAEPLAATAFAPVLARAQLVGDSESDAPPHLAWIAEHLFDHPLPLATAPYAYAALAGTAPDDAFLWQADPVHLELARDHLVLTPLAAPVVDAESDALIEAANALLAAADLELVRAADRWFVRAAVPWQLDAQPLAAVLGRPLHAVMPAGHDAARWNRLLTEIQMTWHAHPVNAAREARGEATINSLWLHGGGAWTALPRPRYGAVLADEPAWRGAAQAAGVRSGSADQAAGDDALVVRSDLLAPRLLQDWTAWTGALHELDAAITTLARRQDLDLVLTGESTLRRLRSRPSDRLKFWRAASLEQTLSE